MDSNPNPTLHLCFTLFSVSHFTLKFATSAMSDKEQALDGGASFLHAAPGVCPVNGKRKSQSQKLQKGLANVFFAFDNITLILIVAVLCCVCLELGYPCGYIMDNGHNPSQCTGECVLAKTLWFGNENLRNIEKETGF